MFLNRVPTISFCLKLGVVIKTAAGGQNIDSEHHKPKHIVQTVLDKVIVSNI